MSRPRRPFRLRLHLRAGPRRGELPWGRVHACVVSQVYLPGAGWVEFDPTNGIIGNRDLIRVAVARDPAQAVPLSGTYYGEVGDELGMSVEVQVTTHQPPQQAGPRSYTAMES
jgi:transglutaminase-like putative cysteine protease